MVSGCGSLRMKTSGVKARINCTALDTLHINISVIVKCINGNLKAAITSEGQAVGQLVEALRYKPKGRRFETSYCH